MQDSELISAMLKDYMSLKSHKKAMLEADLINRVLEDPLMFRILLFNTLDRETLMTAIDSLLK